MDDSNKLAIGIALILSLLISTVWLYFYLPTTLNTPAIVAEADPLQESQTTKPTIETPSSESKDGWISYTSPQGFSLSYPKVTMGAGCSGEASTSVPIRLIEDAENHYTYLTISCSDTLETLREKTRQASAIKDYKQEKIPSAWSIAQKDIRNENDLDTFIKEHYGTGGCVVGERKLTTRQDGVYEVTINGTDWKNPSDGFYTSTSCRIDYAYKLFYSPQKGRAISLVLGQDCTFGKTSSPEDCYEEEDRILDSIKFN